MEPKNSPKSIGPIRKPRPSRVMNTKMPTMKTIADVPPTKTRTDTALSMYHALPR